ncbi:MAG: D-alanine--D-alanine ligase [Bacteroidales bacterium]|nr:D-alanine--D-alanine ligase [Bacteroidales bacterium]
MAKYSNIAVIYGSDSSEWEVSCRSGEFVASRIDDTQYSIYEIFARFGKWQLVAFRKKDSMRITFPEGARPEINKNDFSVNVYGEKVKLDYAYIVQHGKPGENGLLQGYFEMLGIPFSSCSAFVSTVVFDKYSCKNYLRDADFVHLAPDVFVRRGMDIPAVAEKTLARLGLPVFVKPTDGGSSFGISKVKQPEDLVSAIQYAFTEGPSVIIEKAISGREFTCAAYRNADGVQTLPVIEIVTDNEYFDYDAKYNGNSREICPAPISPEHSDRIRETTRKIYEHLGCSGVVRVDYIDGEDGLYFLEVNTIPGMTSASLVPKMVRTAGLDMTAFLTEIIENS